MLILTAKIYTENRANLSLKEWTGKKAIFQGGK